MKVEMQKWLYGMSALAVCVMLVGCSHEHTWADATCTAPKTCTECGEAEGETLEHTWKEATYWEAKTCSECGATEGDPEIPSFVEHGVSVMDVTVGAEYDYVATCSKDESKETLCKLTITDYQIADTYEGYETPEGYEWRIVKVSLWAGDDNARNYSIIYRVAWNEYYDSDFEEDFEEMLERLENVYTINYLGEEYTECLDAVGLNWNPVVGNEYTAEGFVAFRVPKGYDGKVISFGKANGSKNWNEFLDEDSLVFRLK